MRIDVLTLFPEACEPFFKASLLGRAQAAGIVTVQCHDLRQYSSDPHRRVDDRPFGGGPGMVMMCQPVVDAVEAIETQSDLPAARVLLTPAGRRLDQELVEQLARRPRLLLIAGHYEGFDERIRQLLAPLEVSIGDYVLGGGEAAAMVVVDAVARLVPGVLGDAASAREESFSAQAGVGGEPTLAAADDVRYLEYPHYTRPRVFRELAVPDVLLSGDHAVIRAWRAEQARRRTARRRPDLLAGRKDGDGGGKQDDGMNRRYQKIAGSDNDA